MSSESEMLLNELKKLGFEVLVDNFSEELQKNYYANYRQVDSEISLLKDAGFNKVEKHDIYPPRCNKWDNTHYYALVASI